VIKLLLLMLLGVRSTKLMFMHRACGNSQALARDEQEEFLTEVRQTSTRNLKGRLAAFFPFPMVCEDNAFVGRAWDMISLAL